MTALPAIKGKTPKDVEDAILQLHARTQQLQATIDSLKNTVGTLPTRDDLQAHANRIEQALLTMPVYDQSIAGVSTAHKQQGSIPPVVSGSFAYTATGTQIIWFWDGTNGSTILSLMWPDGSITQVPPANQVITGLVASTTYSFFPYFDVGNGGVFFSQDSVAGSGSPRMAFGPGSSILVATRIQSADGHVPLNLSSMQGATTSGGAGGGSGGGRFGGCVSENTEVVALRGDIYSFLTPAETWVELRSLHGRRLRAVPDHRVFAEEGCVRMDRVRRGMRLVTLDGLDPVTEICPVTENGKKRMVWVPQGNLYWANGVLSHNIK